MSETLKGHCMCGAVTVTARADKPEISACHCSMCRRWTSGAMIAFQAAPGMEATGPVRRYASSEWAERAFCETCGSSLWYRVTAPGPHQGQTHIAAGLFEDATGAPLTAEIFIDRKPAGYAFAGEHARMTEAEVMAMFAPPPESGA
ncbi:GFA family protein [Sedimentitalea nanhaiensis]|uniref:Uncharacterized conserved protein n=1 Tax=Sedimentitalea nanhaiensis TaxID=999627 RepID=A0A1I7DYR9_9RHOB|nr:GFA family protein [Sedimentitalea nanhaiensis]SFU16811.1 Uncharacterized conserved protein [Sedimentitalea nanhaiensis]